MNKEEITLIIFGITIIGLIFKIILSMKFKKDMFIEYLKSYKDGKMNLKIFTKNIEEKAIN